MLLAETGLRDQGPILPGDAMLMRLERFGLRNMLCEVAEAET